jgi:hypothetical protein
MDGVIKQKIEQAGRFKVNVKKEEKSNPELKTSLSFIKWEAQEYEYVPKSNNWFWTVGIISVGAATASLLLGNFLFAILMLIAGFAIILSGARKPRKIAFSFTSQGLQIGKRLFPYENLRSFWIHYEPPHKKLLTIELKKFFMPAISIPLGDINPNLVREHLLKFLKEERREESFIQTIIRFAGF